MGWLGSCRDGFERLMAEEAVQEPDVYQAHGGQHGERGVGLDEV